MKYENINDCITWTTLKQFRKNKYSILITSEAVNTLIKPKKMPTRYTLRSFAETDFPLIADK